jgi:hypothetical protein
MHGELGPLGSMWANWPTRVGPHLYTITALTCSPNHSLHLFTPPLSALGSVNHQDPLVEDGQRRSRLLAGEAMRRSLQQVTAPLPDLCSY